MRTNLAKVYAAGDAVSGPSSVIEAMASGRKAAMHVHLDLSMASGVNVEPESSPLRPVDIDYPEIPQDIPSLSRPTMPERQPAMRIKNFNEGQLSFIFSTL